MDDQERSVVELRARAGALIAAVAITTSFFGGQTLGRHDLTLVSWMAIACFVLVGLSVLAVLWPRREWEFAVVPDEFITTYLEPPDADPLAPHMIERDLALHMGRSAETNREQLARLVTVFRAAALLLVCEVLAWVLALLMQR